MSNRPHTLRNHFISGLVVLGPLFVTVLVILYLVGLADAFVVNPLFRIIPWELDAGWLVFLTKLAIAVVVVTFITFVGFLAKRYVFIKFFESWESILGAIPVFNRLYLSVREIAQAFFGDKSGVFKRVVYIEYPRQGVWAVAFVTLDKRWEISEKTGRELLTLFVPSPPNPATGFFVFCPKEQVLDSDMTVEEGIRMVISGGTVVPRTRGSVPAIEPRAPQA
ncbi:MAG: hypothetical protein MOGMAGMI_01425 [Candidatus Omnitrophica bacterium]|nr:hypothetical protein [Candidatus Omnitrophota bacterium]